MNRLTGWSLGLCCGLPLLAALVLFGAAEYGTDKAVFACLALPALLGGYFAYRYFTREDEEVGWELDERDYIPPRD